MTLALRKRLAGMHKFSVYAVITIAFLCVAFGGGVGPIMTVAFSAALVISWYVDARGLIDASYAKWWNGLIVIFVGVTILQLVAADETIISAAIRFVLLLTMVKLFGRFSRRDDLQLYALSFLIFAAATAVNEGVAYGILFGFYVLAGTFSLALFHLNDEIDAQTLTHHTDRTPFDRQYIGVLAAISVIIFASSLAIFFTFPRVGMGFFVSQSRQPSSVTGFSESVELGSHGKIRDDPTVIMRVEFPGGRPEEYKTMHWRTKTFDRYDGQSWSQTLEDTEHPVPRGEHSYAVERVHPEWRAGFSRHNKPRRLDIYLEPLGTNLLPRLWPTETLALVGDTLAMPGNPNSGAVTIDAYGDLRHTIESEVGVPYSLTVVGKPRPARLRQQHVSSGRHTPGLRYLQLPAVSGQFRTLVHRVTDPVGSPYRKAEAVANYLESNYTYTTDLPRVRGGRPIESFLFDTKRGHCEYFATAAVLMLREAGVPARLVNGFLGGRWNSVGGYLGVRQGDAHSWIEIYVPNFGWTPIDPTPAADVLPVEPSRFTQWYRDIYDAMRLNWMKWVIEYDLAAQLDLVSNAGNLVGRRTDAVGKDASDPSDDSPAGRIGRLIWVGLAVVVTCLGLIWIGRRWLKPSSPPVVALFSKIEHAGTKAGVERTRDEGPGAYLERLARAVPAAAHPLAAFRQRYLSARFGGRAPNPKQLAGLGTLVDRIRRRIRRKNR